MEKKKIIFWIVTAGIFLIAGGYFGYKFLFKKPIINELPTDDSGTETPITTTTGNGVETPPPPPPPLIVYSLTAKNSTPIRNYGGDLGVIIQIVPVGVVVGTTDKETYNNATNYMPIKYFKYPNKDNIVRSGYLKKSNVVISAEYQVPQGKG